MAEPKETPIDPDVPDQESMDEFDALTSAFQEHIDEFAREHDLNYGVLSLLSHGDHWDESAIVSTILPP